LNNCLDAFHVGSSFAVEFDMTRSKLFFENPKIIRDILLDVVHRADLLHDQEQKLIAVLSEIDKKRLYVKFGYKSLRGFCNHALKFSRTQSQRIATEVRTFEDSTLLRVRENEPAEFLQTRKSEGLDA
jgi:hypothetical protein